jgi:hypothetical protein
MDELEKNTLKQDEKFTLSDFANANVTNDTLIGL